MMNLNRYLRISIISLIIFTMALSNLWAEGEKSVEDIKGSLSLEAVSRDWGVLVSYLIEGLKLPKDVPLNLALNELKDRHGFTMENVRELVKEYLSQAKLGQVTSISPESKKRAGHEAEIGYG